VLFGRDALLLLRGHCHFHLRPEDNVRWNMVVRLIRFNAR
jgi:hypothetical protein